MTTIRHVKELHIEIRTTAKILRTLNKLGCDATIYRAVKVQMLGRQSAMEHFKATGEYRAPSTFYAAVARDLDREIAAHGLTRKVEYYPTDRPADLPEMAP